MFFTSAYYYFLLQMTTKRSAATISALAIKSIADLPGPASIPIFGSISNYKFGANLNFPHSPMNSHIYLKCFHSIPS